MYRHHSNIIMAIGSSSAPHSQSSFLVMSTVFSICDISESHLELIPLMGKMITDVNQFSPMQHCINPEFLI